MTIKPKQAKWGYALIGLAAILFIFYFYYIKEPLTIKLLDAHKHPNLILAILRSVVFASLFSLLTFVGGALGGFAWQKWADSTNLRLGDALESKAFLWWLAIWNAGFLLFTLFWVFGDF